jgi:Xaa-Pro aminopeptidase
MDVSPQENAMAPGVPTNEIYAERIERAQEEMKRQGIDVLLVGPSSDLVYLIGYDAHLSERLNLLIIRQTGKPDLVVPVLESFLALPAEPNVNLRRWEETESPSELAASLIGDTKGVTLGVSDQLWSTFLLKLQKAMPAADWTTGQPVLAHLRVTKDQSELDNLFEVARLTDEAWHEFVESGQISGLTETQAMDRLSGMMEKRGLGRSFGICASGPNSASPHHHTGDRVIQQGDAVIFDWGGTLNGYHSDVTRTVYVGTPTDEYRKVYNTVREANQAALDAVKPGAPAESIDKAARDVITKAGYGEAFLHRVGHGLGMDVHEEPYLVGGNKTPLEIGMVFSDEPGIYLVGKFGVRIEDSVVVTETGGKRLNEASREITVMD